MTLDEFRQQLIDFIDNSTVNLGRKKTNSRAVFLEKIRAMFDDYSAEESPEIEEKTQNTHNMNDRILVLKPEDRRKALDMGKGVHAMTPTESMRADEQLNRSPYSRDDGGEKKDE